jgi:hypothetical protein
VDDDCVEDVVGAVAVEESGRVEVEGEFERLPELLDSVGPGVVCESLQVEHEHRRQRQEAHALARVAQAVPATRPSQTPSKPKRRGLTLRRASGSRR